MTADRHYLDMAARLAWRGMGRVEPNPMVGAVLVRDGRVIGMGHHRVFGGPHAEREALADCRARGFDPRGATMFVTLEPCTHTGKQPPCTDAIAEAGVSRVVFARRDPHVIAAGGAARLAQMGIAAIECGESELALRVGAPFVTRITSNRPWVIAKWAQSLDGKVAVRGGDSKWISCPTSRRRVHQVRGRVDAILTGIGTVLADDPMLTARGVAVRRQPLRAVVDSRLQLPVDSKLVQSAAREKTVVFTRLEQLQTDAAKRLARLGVELRAAPNSESGVGLAEVMSTLSHEFGVTTVLTEAGPRLLGELMKARIVDEYWVFVAPMIVGDAAAPGAVHGLQPAMIEGAMRLRRRRARLSGRDIEIVLCDK